MPQPPSACRHYSLAALLGYSFSHTKYEKYRFITFIRLYWFESRLVEPHVRAFDVPRLQKHLVDDKSSITSPLSPFKANADDTIEYFRHVQVPLTKSRHEEADAH